MIKKLSGIICLLAVFTLLTACDDDNSTIGSVISKGEVDITLDTIEYNLNAKARLLPDFDSKTGNLMIGNLISESYGQLNCSFVTRLMCSANLEVADSLLLPERVDSVKLILGAQRSQITGDSLAPQVMTVYKLNRQLPSNINNTFDPQGYYDPSQPFASRSYTVSAIAETDSAFYNDTFVDLSLNLPVEFGREIFTTYRDNPSVFQWPQTMAEEFLPGIFVESSFGNGCVANISSVYVSVFYYSKYEETEKDEEGEEITVVKHLNHMAVPFTVSPEVLSSNNITYVPSDNIVAKNENETNGEVVLTTPGGYIAEFEFPAQDLLNRYREKDINLSTVNELMLFIPAESFGPDSGIGVASNVLMIKSSEYEDFFARNKTPDNLNSFTGIYDSNNGRYYFTTMRNYFIRLLEKDEITPEDVEFTIIPVEIETETVNSYYGEGATYVVKCVPLTSKPTMTLLKTNEAKVAFSFSTQLLE